MADKNGKKKRKLGLIVGLVLLILFASAGAVVGLAMSGKINIPGLTPKKKPIAAPAAAKPKPKPKVQPKKEETPPPADPPATTKVIDKVGAQKLAEIWNEMVADKLLKVTDKWEAADLAVVFNEMDPQKVAEVMALMKPETASKVSQELKQVASQVPIEAQ